MLITANLTATGRIYNFYPPLNLLLEGDFGRRKRLQISDRVGLLLLESYSNIVVGEVSGAIHAVATALILRGYYVKRNLCNLAQW